MSEIKEFYAGKNVLVTGATGFVGKVLVEKILRDCNDVNCVYLLIRNRDNNNFAQRRKDYLNHLVFDNIRNNNPKQLEKVKIFNGDLTKPDLNMSYDDLQQIYEHVQIVLHSGACVRFDLPIWEAVNSNTLGTHRMLELSKRIKQLEIFVYVSTAYSQSYVDVTEEQHYKSQIDTFTLAKACKRFNENTMNALRAKILGNFPNTYSLSKHLGEDLVYQYRNDFPICVVRPSVVTAAVKDPVPNYCEGLNGFFGAGIGAARGVIRSFFIESDGYVLCVPVDKVANAVITTSWLHATKKKWQIDYYNASIIHENSGTFKLYCELLKELRFKMPLNYSIWAPNGSFTRCIYYHYIRVVLYQIIPAICIDILLGLFHQQPIMMKVQRKIFSTSQTLVPYCRSEIRFSTDRFATIHDQQNSMDKTIFDTDMRKVDKYSTILGTGNGMRKFICKETEEDIPRAMIIAKVLYFIHVVANAVIMYFILKFMCRRYLNIFLL